MNRSTSMPPPEEIAAFAAELLRTTGSLMLILDHLSRFDATGAAAPDPEPVPEMMARLLGAVLLPLREWHGTVALGEAAALLADAGDLAREAVFGGGGALDDGDRAGVAGQSLSAGTRSRRTRRPCAGP